MRHENRWPARPVDVAFGGDYNPDQWDEAVWLEDVRLMREAGVTMVTLGVFSWALLEPCPGTYNFAGTDRVMELLHGAGIAVDLATPTASPPAWLAHEHPEILPITREGTTLGLGAREAFCPSSPAYRRAATRIAGALGAHYAGHPALAMWHVNNEYGAHVPACYCEVSAAAFRDWLTRRYGTLEGLNDAWGTAVWGQAYGDWEHIQPPRQAPMPVNPSQQLDFMRFSCEEFLTCYRAERDELRRHTPDVPITTNFMVTNAKFMDYWRWAEEVDVVSNDHYLVSSDPARHVELAMAADLTRGVAMGRPWLLMEHSTGAVNWQPRNVTKLPGEMRLNTFAHLARGADGALFFQWRASRTGAEKFHSAMLPHAGTASRTWRDVCELGTDIAAIAGVKGSRVAADAAILWDWESWWALELEFRPTSDLSYVERVRAFYEALWRNGVTVDFVHPDSDLSGYRLVLAPSLYLCRRETGGRLERFVRGGGRLLVSYFSGVVDDNDRIHPGPYPGALRELLGLTVEDFHPLGLDEPLLVDDHGSADLWSERVVLEGADALSRFGSGPDAGQPAVTRHVLGDGTAWYIATRLNPTALDEVVRNVLVDAGVDAALDSPAEVEAVRRLSDDAEYVFVLNHDRHDVAKVDVSGLDLLTGETYADGFELAPAGVAVIRRERPRP
jgi:beta-galactosidase